MRIPIAELVVLCNASLATAQTSLPSAPAKPVTPPPASATAPSDGQPKPQRPPAASSRESGLPGTMSDAPMEIKRIK